MNHEPARFLKGSATPPVDAPRLDGRPFSLRSHLVALVVAVLLPALAFGAAGAWIAFGSYRAAADARLTDTARALATGLDALLGTRLAALRAVTEAADVATASAVVEATFGVAVTLHDGTSTAAEAIQRAARDGAPTVTSLAPGAQEVLLLVPSQREGAAAQVAAMPLPMRDLTTFITGQAAARVGAVAITDANGLIVARSRAAEAAAGQPRPPRRDDGPLGVSGLLQGRSVIDGAALHTAWHRISAAPGWMVWVNEPQSSHAAARSGLMLALAAGGVLALGTGLVAVVVLSRRVLRPVQALVARAEATAFGEAPRPQVQGVAEFAALATAMHRAEVALRNSEAEFRAAFEQSHVPMYQMECDTGILVRANPAYCALLGREVTALIGRPFIDFVHPDDCQADLEGYRRMCRGDVPSHNAVKRYVTADGGTRWVRLSASPVRDADGRVRRSIAVVTDVTGRRAAEAALQESEAQLRRVQRIGRVGGFEIDLRSGDNKRSGEYMALQGQPPLDAREEHRDWVRRLHPEDRERAEAHFLATIADGSSETEYAQEYRIVLPSGGVRWIAARAEIERDEQGRALRMLGAHLDVTELKVAEAALRDNEHRLRVALDAAQLGAWEVDLRNGIATRSPRTLEIFGFGEEQGGYPAFRDRIHEQDQALLTEAVDTVRHGRAERYQVEYRFMRGDGSWRWLESHGSVAARDPATGEATRLIGTTRDVTERKQAEERQALLAREVDHRAKNALAVVQAALRLTAKEDIRSYARAVEGRVAALARAHTLLADGHWQGASVRDLAEGELCAFLPGIGPAADRRVTLDGPPLVLLPAAAQAVSMTLHELATNATKYGALSVAGGTVGLRWQADAASRVFRLRWEERQGPPITGQPERRGFGSRVIEATVQDQLGGKLERRWEAGGLVVEAAIPLARAVMGAGPAPRGTGPD